VTVSETALGYFFYASRENYYAIGEIEARSMDEAIDKAFSEGERQMLIQEGDDILRNAG
ncbi:hypothetical protein IAI33_11430, partial [Streptococcus pseudopneumoniae]|nr:hypothetical protein [Streptococcus pseudopneumoniae]